MLCNWKAKLMAIFVLILLTFGVFTTSVHAIEDKNGSTEDLHGRVEKILEEKDITENNVTRKYQKLLILITKGSKKGERIEIENGLYAMTQLNRYEVGNKLIVSYSKTPESEEYYITDYVRTSEMSILLGIFILLAIVIAQKRGFMALVSLVASFIIIFVVILPWIQAGKDPVIGSILGAIIIIPITFYMSHGLNKKTTVSIMGTTIALIITGVLSALFVNITHMSGMSSDEAMYLQLGANISYDLPGLLIAGIIIGTLGVLDDVSVSQTAIVYQLDKLDSTLYSYDLYKHAIEVGKDHISSMINTLVLVYTGASMPLLLLFLGDNTKFFDIINYEYVAVEIVRTLIGSIGVIITVPITTLLAVYFVKKSKKVKSK